MPVIGSALTLHGTFGRTTELTGTSAARRPKVAWTRCVRDPPLIKPLDLRMEPLRRSQESAIRRRSFVVQDAGIRQP